MIAAKGDLHPALSPLGFMRPTPCRQARRHDLVIPSLTGYQPMASGNHVAIQGKQNTSASPTSCMAMNGSTPR